MTIDAQARAALVRRGTRLTSVTLAYNVFEGVASIVAGAFAGSIALVGFGLDSMIEVTSSLTALWRLRADADHSRRASVEYASVRVIGVCFLALAVYIAIGSARALWRHDLPDKTIAGILIAVLSLVVMPILARAKRAVAAGLDSRALRADATQTDLCMYLSAIVLGGLLLNALLGWWWADPVAGLVMVPIIVREGLNGLRGDRCDDCAC